MEFSWQYFFIKLNYFYHCLLALMMQLCEEVLSSWLNRMQWIYFLPSCLSDTLPSDPVQQQYNFWLSLVDKLGVKAFVDLTLSPSVRQGTQHLLRITGLGELRCHFFLLTRRQSVQIMMLPHLHSVTLVPSAFLFFASFFKVAWSPTHWFWVFMTAAPPRTSSSRTLRSVTLWRNEGPRGNIILELTCHHYRPISLQSDMSRVLDGCHRRSM